MGAIKGKETITMEVIGGTVSDLVVAFGPSV
jgi:hypothetical protein